ncbi:hypothetical protein PIB30_117009 [Stylosanthes scabra]|uniref:Reverse transcriptase Ty1/copia-type domain-containing protein n=1 Tax=Stylosanthes scabra TaxID=79078 RepID=A0ABU6SC28_9FABA|nr:hypothetical protein [Stylosanthes scabra]
MSGLEKSPIGTPTAPTINDHTLSMSTPQHLATPTTSQNIAHPDLGGTSQQPSSTTQSASPIQVPIKGIEKVLPINTTNSETAQTSIPITNTHAMTTRSKTGNLKPRTFLTNTTAQIDYTKVIPDTAKQALLVPQWKQTMDTELQALNRCKTWSLVDPPHNAIIVTCKWVFALKKNPQGEILRYKARLVAKGFQQKKGVDYEEIFSPVVRPTTIRIIITIALTQGWVLKQFDFDNAFLNGFLTESVYMQQPPNYPVVVPNKVCKLHKAIYGLKQAPRAWYKTLSQTLHQFGFKNATHDIALFIRNRNKEITYILVYVDDIVITGSNSEAIQVVINQLNSIFPLKDLGKLHYFLGLEVTDLGTKRLLLSQTKYTKDLLRKVDMTDAKPMPTPITSSLKLFHNDSDLFDDPKKFRSIVGALQYLTITRSDIAYSVNRCSQFMQNPTIAQWKAVKRILRYLQGSIQQGIIFNKCTNYRILAFSNADWASDLDDRRSISGFCIFLGTNLIS